MDVHMNSVRDRVLRGYRLLLGVLVLLTGLLLGDVGTAIGGVNRVGAGERVLSDQYEAASDAPAEEESLRSSVPPQSIPSYRSPGAYVVYGAGAMGLVVGFVWWRTARLERERRKLQGLLHKRTTEVDTQKGQLETYNQELLRTIKTLRQTIEEKSRILGMAAHDLKNPIFGIRALSEIVLETEALSPKGERKLNLIRESAEETLHLIDGLLSSASASETTKREHQPVDVAALLPWIVQGFEPQAERKNQTLHCTVPDGVCVVRGDRYKLREAVNNLISNALKYSPAGSDVTVVLERTQGEVHVAVADAGPGLSNRDKQRMFVPFQRLSAKPTGGEGSSGLGLYIVKQIVESHGGAIDVESSPGAGSTFVLRFPRLTESSRPDVDSPSVNRET